MNNSWFLLFQPKQRMYAPDTTLEDKSLEEVESLENLLSNTLTRVSQRKEYLLANMPPYDLQVFYFI